jgi:ERO1-like protein alpha
LLLNPEAYTGYQGQHIWNAIFRENCFSDRLDSICTEEKVFYKMFSGLLTNTNIQISSNYYDNSRNYSYVNISLFNERVSDHKDRIDNLYFLYTLLVKAFNKAENLIKNFEIHTGNQTEDKIASKLIEEIYTADELETLSHICNQNEDEVNKFLNFNKMDQLMMRFRNISSIIDCVSCQKCKLHGKLQVYGIASMLKILSDKNQNMQLIRNELIAFVNFFAKVSRSISYIKKINENIKYSHFSHKIKYFLIISCYIFVALYVNFILFRKKTKIEEDKKKYD